MRDSARHVVYIYQRIEDATQCYGATETAMTSGALIDDCFDPGRDRLRHADALAILKARVTPVVGTEVVSLAAAVGRVMAETVMAPMPVPAHTNSAVDGYAFAFADYAAGAISALPLAGRAAAGHPLAGPSERGAAIRILTGAVMPEGLDTIAMQEDCVLDDTGSIATVRLPRGLKAGANRRRAGEDIEKGAELIAAGTVLRPQDLAGLASIGSSEARVYQRLRVGVLSTGDEVVRPGVKLAPGQVFDANHAMLAGLIQSAGLVMVDLGVAPDDPARLRQALLQATRHCDVILASGGASRGEEDHMIGALDALGRRHLWQLAIKPGRPMTFGQIGTCVVVGLPGNPVAVFVCYLLYVWPLLRRLGGAPWPEPRRFMLPAAFAFTGRKRGRREFWRGILQDGPEGLVVDKFARDGSGLISGLRAADGLIDIPEEAGDVALGDPVAFIPFSEFAIAGR